jgi:hypothetical protein
MTICSHCGTAIEPGLDACQSCGMVVARQTETSRGTVPGDGSSPQVELISRGWDVVDLEVQELPSDPLGEDDVTGPTLPPGAVEIAIDDISIVTNTEEEPPQVREAPLDPWDHLRPKGEMPKLARRASVPARIVQTIAVLTTLSAVGAAAVHFYLNTQLEALADGRTSEARISDIETVADISLIVVAGVATAMVLGWLVWRWHIRTAYDPTAGKAGKVAMLAFVAGIGVTVGFYLLRGDTVAEGIAANSLIVIGLGLVTAASLLTGRTVSRIEDRTHI